MQPLATRPFEIMSPMPRAPPVTSCGVATAQKHAKVGQVACQRVVGTAQMQRVTSGCC